MVKRCRYGARYLHSHQSCDGVLGFLRTLACHGSILVTKGVGYRGRPSVYLSSDGIPTLTASSDSVSMPSVMSLTRLLKTDLVHAQSYFPTYSHYIVKIVSQLPSEA